MKILAISDVDGGAEKVADAFESTGVSIIAKEERISMRELGERVLTAFDKGYDYAIVVTRDHISAMIVLNKMNNIRAALCDTDEDVRLSRNNGANVLIVKPSQKRFDYLCSIVAQQQQPAKQDKKQQAEQKAQQRQEERPRKQAPVVEDKEDGEYEDYEKSGGKGIVGKLKDSLGIVDKK